MKYLVISFFLIGLLVFVTTVPDSHGLILGHPMEFWESADIILDGTVISTKTIDSENLIQHDVKIEQIFKNKKPQQMMTVYGATYQNEEWFYQKSFEVNDRALLYLKKIDDRYFILEHSRKAIEPCTPRDMIGLSTLPGEGIARGGPTLFFNPYQTCNGFLTPAGMIRDSLPPSKQLESGITPGDVNCRNDNQLMFRENGSVACVNKSSVSSLMDRGWMHVDNQDHLQFKSALPTIWLDMPKKIDDSTLLGFTIEVMDFTENNSRPIITITDKNQNTVWTGQHNVPFSAGWLPFAGSGYRVQYAMSDYPEDVKLDAGTYMLSVSLENQKITKKLTVVESVYSHPFGSSGDNYSDLDPIYRNNPDNPGELILDLDAMIKKYDLNQKINVPVYPAFANGVTEIINPEHKSLEYRATSPVIDETYLSKNVQQWKDAWPHELEAEYEKYGDEFYTEIGRLLMKNEMQYQMNNLEIVNADDDFEVFSGGALTSLPPHIGFSAVIYATDKNYYRLEGGTHANQVSYYRTTQLQFPDITKKLSMESIISKPQLITIIPEDGLKARQKPSTLVVHMNNNVVEFFNNTPEVIRIQDSGSGRVGEENTLSWMGPIILPFQKATITFDKPGLIEWDARNAPNLEDPLWWSTHAGGNIVVLSDDIDNFSRDDKSRIAQEMLHNSDIPIVSSGAGNAEKVLKLGLDPAVTKMIPNAEEYYLQRAHQLIPFDVEIVMYE